MQASPALVPTGIAPYVTSRTDAGSVGEFLAGAIHVVQDAWLIYFVTDHHNRLAYIGRSQKLSQRFIRHYRCERPRRFTSVMHTDLGTVCGWRVTFADPVALFGLLVANIAPIIPMTYPRAAAVHQALTETTAWASDARSVEATCIGLFNPYLNTHCRRIVGLQRAHERAAFLDTFLANTRRAEGRV